MSSPPQARFTMIASAYLLCIKNGQILLSRRFQTGYEDGQYSLPAGHVEDNETLIDALIREVYEEIGLEVSKENIQLAHVMHRKDFDIRMDFFFTASEWSGEPKNCEPEKCDDLEWFSIAKLPKNTIPYIRSAITAYQNKVLYSEFGWRHIS